jgi:hypothetical protein
MNPFSLLWSTKLSDWQRGLIVAIIATPLTIIYDTVTATPMVLTFDWKKILGAALAAGIAYILKNFATGINGNILTNSTKSVVTGTVTPEVPKEKVTPK